MSAPRFTVVLPTWRRGPALRATIDGVLAQDERSWELLVVDDASGDDTADVAEAVGDERIRVLRRVDPSGDPCAPRNDGLSAARGRYVAYLDHDDRWAPTHLTALGALLDAGADVAATGCWWATEGGEDGGESGESGESGAGGESGESGESGARGENGARGASGARDAGGPSGPSRAMPAGGARPRPRPRRSGLLDVTWSPELQLVGPLVEPSRVAHRAGVAERVGGWRTGRGLEDWDLWVRLSDRRWATTDEATATVVASPGSRRHALAEPAWVPVATTPDASSARRTLSALRRAPERARLRELHAAAMHAWHHDELRAGRLVLPAGASAADLDSALAAAVPADPTAQLAPRRDPGGGWSLGRALATTDPAHHERAAAVLAARLAPKYDYVRRMARAVSAEPAHAHDAGAIA